MHLTVLGSSGSYPIPGRPASGYLLTEGHTRVWCDAGPGTFAALGDQLDLELVTAIVVSHQHPDHCADLLAVLHRWAYAPDGRTGVPLYAPQAVWERIRAFLDPGPDHPIDRVFDFDPVGDGDERRIGDLSVRFAVTDHSVPTVGSRWESGSRVLAYTADTGPGGSWHHLAEDADLLLAEATYQGDRGDLEVDYPYHLTAAEAGRIAREQRAERLVLTHIPAHADPVVSIGEAETSFGRPVEVAVPGTRQKV